LDDDNIERVISRLIGGDLRYEGDHECLYSWLKGKGWTCEEAEFLIKELPRFKNTVRPDEGVRDVVSIVNGNYCPGSNDLGRLRAEINMALL